MKRSLFPVVLIVISTLTITHAMYIIPVKIQEGEILSSRNWNNMIETLLGLEAEVRDLETILQSTLNKSDIPNMQNYVTTQQLNALSSTSGSCPTGTSLHICAFETGYEGYRPDKLVCRNMTGGNGYPSIDDSYVPYLDCR